MPRRPHLAAIAATAVAALLLGACTGGAPDREGARDRARDVLTSRAQDPLDTDTATEVANCIAAGMFDDTDVVSADQRNEVLLALDGTPPSDALVESMTALLEECDALPGAEPQAGRGDSDDDADATTTTEG